MGNALEDVDPELFERVWKITTEIGATERHFNGIESTYRNIASGWLLATLGGIGFAVTQDLKIDVAREVLIAAVALGGSGGIVLLWILDLLVYHRLLQSVFVEGLILEGRYPWLPPFRHNMLASQHGAGVQFREAGFYMLPVVVLLAVASGALGLWLYRVGWPQAALVAGLAGFGVIVATIVAIRHFTNDAEWWRERVRQAEHDGVPPVRSDRSAQ